MNTIHFDSAITVPLKTFTASTLLYSITDDGQRVVARFAGVPGSLVMWGPDTTPTYLQAGDYTQAQVDARVRELLGADPASVLARLMPPNLA